MKIVEQEISIETYTPNICRIIEIAGRNCYKSECKNSDDFIRAIIRMGHHSVLEHGNITARIITDRATSHQIVRHRLCAFSQESQRYCNYSKGKFGHSISFIKPSWADKDINAFDIWKNAMNECEYNYFRLIDAGYDAEHARTVLPNSTKTEIIMTTNAREWRHIFSLRTSTKASPQIQDLMSKGLILFRCMWPALFDDINNKENIYGSEKESI